MKRIYQLLCILCLSFAFADKPATIKVLLHKEASSPLVEIKGRYQVCNPYDGAVLTSGILSKRYPVTVEDYGLKWGEKFPGTYQIRLMPGDSQSTILVNGIQYRGCIEIYSADSKMDVVNEVDVESYLRAILASAMPEPMEEEVMNAIAIVARTNTYHLLAKKSKNPWSVDAGEVGYSGSAIAYTKPHVERAIEATRHAVLLYQDSPFAATWTKNSAGRTANFASIFRKAITAPPGVETPLAAKDREAHKWTFSIPRQALAKTANLRSVTSVELYLAHNSDKVYAVKLSDGMDSNDIDFFTLQKVIGAQKLRSTDFTVAVKGDNLIFTGYGEGPGVGLCLYSAQAMAQKGDKASKILSAFFPDTRLEKIRSLTELK